MTRTALVLAAFFALQACSAVGIDRWGADKEPAQRAAPSPDAALGSLGGPPWREAVFLDAAGGRAGSAAVLDATNGVLVRVDLVGLTSGWHGVHIHMTGTCDDGAAGFKASGGHYDPANMEHGLENPNGFEAGDLPNVYAGPDGRATAEFFKLGLSASSIFDADGSAIIVHANPDDHKSQPIGGAGDRVACAALTR